jgi:2Fe-2S ferredoxin
MPKLSFIQHDGVRYDVEVPEGTSVMKAALERNIPGIDGDCGGACACATCHVFVDPAWYPKAMAPNAREIDMLGFAATVQENSRLACQIRMSAQLDGLVVRLPENQH